MIKFSELPNLPTLSQRLAWAMERKGLSQTGLAKLAKVTQPAISHLIGKGTKQMKASTIVAVAKALEVSESWLQNGSQLFLDNERLRTTQEYEMLLIFRQLSAHDQGRVCERAQLLFEASSIGSKSRIHRERRQLHRLV
jgi:transcriptional regulator with XRE-family HTH domain